MLLLILCITQNCRSWYVSSIEHTHSVAPFTSIGLLYSKILSTALELSPSSTVLPLLLNTIPCDTVDTVPSSYFHRIYGEEHTQHFWAVILPLSLDVFQPRALWSSNFPSSGTLLTAPTPQNSTRCQ